LGGIHRFHRRLAQKKEIYFKNRLLWGKEMMIGFLSLSSSFSRFFEFFFLFCMKKSSQKRALERDLGKDKRRGEIESFGSLSVSQKAKISSRMKKYLGGQRSTKRRQKASKEEENILSLSLFLGRQGFLSPPIVVVNIISRLCETQSSTRRKKAYSSTRTQKNPISKWWREEVLLGVLLIERSVFARAFPP
jgi:hypothetical protein